MTLGKVGMRTGLSRLSFWHTECRTISLPALRARWWSSVPGRPSCIVVSSASSWFHPSYKWINPTWLVVWNHGILWRSIQLGMKNHPNWQTPWFFRGVGLNHQPVEVEVTRQVRLDLWWYENTSGINQETCHWAPSTVPSHCVPDSWKKKKSTGRRWAHEDATEKDHPLHGNHDNYGAYRVYTLW